MQIYVRRIGVELRDLYYSVSALEFDTRVFSKADDVDLAAHCVLLGSSQILHAPESQIITSIEIRNAREHNG